MDDFINVVADDVRDGDRLKLIAVFQINDGNSVVLLVGELSLAGSSLWFLRACREAFDAFGDSPDRSLGSSG